MGALVPTTPTGAGNRWTVHARTALTFHDFGGHNDDDRSAGALYDAAVYGEGDTILWVGPRPALPPEAPEPLHEVSVLCPAFVECHTHALHAGSRSGDFHRRNRGKTYAEILLEGGGIMSTVLATRGTDDETLEAALRARLTRMQRKGVGVVEVKSGYGLSVEHELRHLRVIDRVARTHDLVVRRTCLAGHLIPTEWRDRREEYIDAVCHEILPLAAAEGIVDQVDVFCEEGALTIAESRRVLETARNLGLGRRIHAEQFSNTGATALACELTAQSADHLEYVTEDDALRMAEAGVAAVVFPTLNAFLDQPKRPPIELLRRSGVRIALSTDYNPGSSHCLDMQLCLSLGCSLFKLPPGLALRAVTRVPAEVLGLGDRFGTLAPGRAARLLAFDVHDWRDIPFHMTDAPLKWLEIPGA